MRTSDGSRQHRRAGLAAFVGTTVEWYDFYVFSTAAALVFGPVFFPSSNAITGLAASFATYAVGFVARPLGAIIFGHIGDRIGRRPALVATLILMGAATFLTGLLPAYATIGSWAPILLVALRIVQGVAVGGEWGGAVLLAVEHAPEKSKTFYGGFPQLGNPAGGLLATGVFSIFASLGQDDLVEWGWRGPFLISAALIAVGIYVRARVEESPVFDEGKTKSRAQTELPLKYAVVNNWKSILLATGMVAVPSGGYYIVTTYATAYATGDSVGLSATFILNVLTVGSFFELIATLPSAWLGDRFGRVRVFIAGVVAMGLLGLAEFVVLSGPSHILIFVVFSAMRFASSGAYAALATLLAQMFPTESRYTSMSLAYQGSAAIFGGLSPLAATLLYSATGSVWPVIGLLLALCALAVCCALFAPQLSDETIADPATAQPKPGVTATE
ncbi:MFS transporter [Saccharopolyspora sp. NPDC050389]|uniref:MFS transporter n=1 Tax=Saccharopolyspora sp. NPDC050389 TaxID=3155516 RepID=UPI0033F1FDDE